MNKTIQKHIDHVRHELKKFSDDTLDNLSDEFIYDKLLIGRTRAIRMSADKNQFMSDSNFQVVCIDLEDSTIFEKCNCGSIGCKVKKSKVEIPQFMVKARGYLAKVKDLSGKSIGFEYLEFKGGSRIPKKKLQWDRIDNKLLVYQTNSKAAPTLKKVLIHGIFNDPWAATRVSVDCVSISCYDPSKDPFPIDQGLEDVMYKITIENLIRNIRGVLDVLNDDNEERAINV
tara:strand:- start:6388 stop:7074 length:687 start_codon:yes stop_codon:yes gene_type:complete